MIDRSGALASCVVPAAWLALAGLGVVAAVHLLELPVWPFELVHHFAFHSIIVALVLALVFAGFRLSLPATGAVLLALLFGGIHKDAPQPLGKGTLAPFGAAQALDFEGISSRTRRLTLITHNLMAGNWRYRDVYGWLAAQPADVVALQEVSTGMVAMLRSLADVYPHQVIVGGQASRGSETDWGLLGLAILSRYPITEHEVLRSTRRNQPGIVARLSVTGADNPWIVVVHPWNPVAAANLAARDRYLAEIAEAVTRLPGPVIVAGDFNVTPYAPAFRAFLRATRTTTFTDFPATYPAPLGPLGIPIDHVLVSGIRLAELEALPSIGSDHRPLKALLFLPTTGDPAVQSANNQGLKPVQPVAVISTPSPNISAPER